MTRVPESLERVFGRRGSGVREGRTLGVMLQFWQNLQVRSVVSRVFGERVVVRSVGVTACWDGDPGADYLTFRLTTGIGERVSDDQVRDAWETIVPFYEVAGPVDMMMRGSVYRWEIPVGRAFAEYGRRFGLWAQLHGTTHVWVYAWVNLET